MLKHLGLSKYMIVAHFCCALFVGDVIAKGVMGATPV